MWWSDSRRLQGQKSHDIDKLWETKRYEMDFESPRQSLVSSVAPKMRVERSKLRYSMEKGILDVSVVGECLGI